MVYSVSVSVLVPGQTEDQVPVSIRLRFLWCAKFCVSSSVLVLLKVPSSPDLSPSTTFVHLLRPLSLLGFIP